MPDRIAIKRLSLSDLTFFEALFRRLGVGNQKSINLNADVFTGQLYPALAGNGSAETVDIPLSVTALGPGMAGPYRFPRSVTKGPAYKNWRLNGAAVPDPEGEPDRFGRLTEGDIAVMEFKGEPVPSELTLILLSAVDDAALHGALLTAVPDRRRSMVRVERADLADLADRGDAAEDHPIRSILIDPTLESDLEEAALGSASGMKRLQRRRGRPITAQDLARARANAERVGREGEALAFVHLDLQRKAGRLREVVWTSQANAQAPWDFEVTTAAGETIRIDAKSTEGSFGQRIHISAGELDTAAHDGVRYDIMRLYDMDQDRARVRVAADIGVFARRVVDGLSLPPGVEPDGFSIDPTQIPSWTAEETVERPDEPDQL
jgi:hypothetical protein